MEAFLAENLTAWIASLDGSEKLNFWGFGLNALFTLSRTPLHLPFLHAAARFWNPVTHVFSFGGQEVCPTLEDFQVLMESESQEEILPQFCFGHAQALGQMCGLTVHDARSLVCNGELDILGLIHRFSDAGDRSNHYWQGFRQHALCLCLLSHFLLCPSFGGSNICLIEVAQGLREGKSCIAMTLAETLMGLDAFHRRETTRFAGSPLPLQVVDSCSAYSARGYFFRQHLVNALHERWWFDWMRNLSADRIAWRCPWLNLPAMSYSMSRLIGIQLVGLTHCVFYFPFRFLRQFGHDQICPPEGIEYPAAFPVRGAQLARYATVWRTRELLAPAPTFSCTLSDECLDWLNEEAQVGPSLASEASTSSGRGRRDT
ncbi:hypothetical protein HYC85_029918 [Camellia sinensis]|uniref:Aminotransferase-like plant mobile domain-containing protein n=1 Tax=Camellia sinensis TaxID=4442 RepID=A0A7J7FZY0_CAMSI|nr:hypothetical protein HYC85_029918 [Camellia sinensis]